MRRGSQRTSSCLSLDDGFGIKTAEQGCTAAEHHRRHIDCQLADQPALRYWTMVLAPPAIRISRSPETSRACSRALSISSLTK